MTLGDHQSTLRRLTALLRMWFPLGKPSLLDRGELHQKILGFGMQMSTLDMIDYLDELHELGKIVISRSGTKDTIEVIR